MGLISLPNTLPWLSLIWLSLFVPSLLIVALPATQKQAIRAIGTLFSLIFFVLVALVFFGYAPAQGGVQFAERLGWLPQLGANYLLGVDGVNLPLLLLQGLLVLSAALLSWSIDLRLKEYWFFLLLVASAIAAALLSFDLFLLFAFFLLALWPIYLLLGIWGGSAGTQLAQSFLRQIAIGGLLIGLGLAGLYFGGGLRTFDLLTLERLLGLPIELQSTLFLLLAVGFGLFIGVAPLWLPKAIVAAPLPLGLLLAVALPRLAIYAILRAGVGLMPLAAETLLPLLTIILLFSLAFAFIEAIQSPDLRHVLGLIIGGQLVVSLLGLNTATQSGLLGLLLLLFTQGLAAVPLLLAYHAIASRELATDLGALAGLRKQSPVLFGMLALALLAGVAGFWPLFYLLSALWLSAPIIAGLLGLLALLLAVYLLYVLYRLITGQTAAANTQAPAAIIWQEWLALGLPIALLLFSGIYAAGFVALISPHVLAFIP